MTDYPVSLRVAGRTCLIVGGGAVALRKAAGLLEAGARVVVISPALATGFPSSHVTHMADVYRSDTMARLQPFLVFAATDDPAVNRQVTQDARRYGALVNTADGSGADDFSNLVALRRDPVSVTIGTGGASPALAAHLREAIDAVIGDHYPILAGWLGDLRPQVTAALPDPAARRDFWRCVLESDVLTLLEQGEQRAAWNRLMAIYEDALRTTVA
jgi:siroheme synthase-like protein